MKISEPLSIGTLTAPNRLVMPPMVIWQTDFDGHVKENHKIHYRRTSGAGYVIVEATAVSPEGRLSPTQLGISDDSQIEGLTELASLIKESGALAGIQIHHAGGTAKRENSRDSLQPLVVSLEAYPEGFDARVLTCDDIKRIIADFADGAERAVQAGFDIIELHGAHGYLIAQFLSPQKNRRNDAYGGSPENRRRFLKEVIEAVKARIDGRAELSVRLGVADAPGAEGEPYLTLEEGLDAARMCEKMGIALLNISCSHGADPALKPQDSPWSSLVHHAIAAHKAVSIPVIAVGEIKQPGQAEQLVAEGLVDMTAVAKGVLADPAWFHGALSGEEIHPCLGCKRCLWFKKEQMSRCPAWVKRGEVPF